MNSHCPLGLKEAKPGCTTSRRSVSASQIMIGRATVRARFQDSN